MIFLKRLVFLLACLAMPLTAASAAAAAASKSKPVDWARTVQATPAGGYLIGNPKAPIKVIEYFSLTCPHCRHFVEEGLPVLKKGEIARGRVSLELRNFVLNPYDMSASLLMRCTASPAQAARLYDGVFAQQDAVFGGAQALGQDAIERVKAAPEASRMAVLAREAKIDRWFVAHGVPAAKAAKCLADPAGVDRLVAMRDAGVRQYEIKGTPGFIVNGKLVDGADWASLDAAIKAAR